MRLPSSTRGEGVEGAPLGPASTGLAFDPASLPPIQSITADTDIRGFLRSGVPSELTRAALRRAWVCDPKIKDFVGLAEYDWDFNAPDSMPGFGPLQVTDEVEKMAARILEPTHSESEPSNPSDPAPTTPTAGQIAAEADINTAHGASTRIRDEAEHRDEPVNEIGSPAHPGELTHREHEPIAAQYKVTKTGNTKPDKNHTFFRRQHGGALPK